jgi:hypothetical protein
MTKTNNGQSLSLPSAATVAEIHPLITQQRVKPIQRRKQKQAVQAIKLLASGEPIRATARETGLDRNTVRSIARLNRDEIENAKQLLIAHEISNAKASAQRLAETISTAPPAVANAIHGTAVDKLLALSGDVSLTVRHEHFHELRAQHDKLAQDLIALHNEKPHKLVRGTVVATHQLGEKTQGKKKTHGAAPCSVVHYPRARCG